MTTSTLIQGVKEMSQLFAFLCHGWPTLVGTGSEAEAQTLCAMMNQDRALDPYIAQPITEAEIGIEEPFRIADEIARSRAVVEAAVRDNPTVNSSKG
jgi:hypothetical protein